MSTPGLETVIQTVVEKDGEIHLTGLPYRKRKHLEVVFVRPTPKPIVESDSDRNSSRQAARERFLAQARASKFHSEGPYPTRDELHGRD